MLRKEFLVQAVNIIASDNLVSFSLRYTRPSGSVWRLSHNIYAHYDYERKVAISLTGAEQWWDVWLSNCDTVVQVGSNRVLKTGQMRCIPSLCSCISVLAIISSTWTLSPGDQSLGTLHRIIPFAKDTMTPTHYAPRGMYP